jgi:hypothetical protein
VLEMTFAAVGVTAAGYEPSFFWKRTHEQDPAGPGLRAVWPSGPAGPCGFAPPRNSSRRERHLVLFGGRALLSVKLGRHASPGCCSCCQASSCCGTPTGSSSPGRSSYPR